MKTSDPWLDLILPTFNNSALTVRFLESLGRHTRPGHCRVIWVDNGSTEEDRDRVRAALDGFEMIALLFPERIGFVKAVNAGLEQTTAPYVAIQNNDTEIFSDIFTRLRWHLDQYPNTGLVGPVSTSGWQHWRNLTAFVGHVTIERLTAFKTDAERANHLATTQHQSSQAIGSMLAFFCVLGRRQLFQRIGPLALEYGDGFGDDDDYCERVKAHGLGLRLALDCLVFHQHRSTFKNIYSLTEIAQLQQMNMDLFKSKWRK